jgi:uncharacterized protein YjcR
MALLAKFKAYAYAIGAAIVGFGLLILRNMMLKGQRDKARDNAKTYKAQAEQAQAIQKVDAEIELEYSDLEREAKKAIKNGEMPSNIRNRNSY